MSAAGSPPAPAVTAATASSDAELAEAIALFLPIDPATITFERASGGVNNKCYFVKTPANEEYLLRVYNNGGATARVEYEHAVLRMLSESGAKFSFSLPVPLPSLADAKATSALLASGASASLFHRIAGSPPEGGAAPDVARAIGAATAEIVRGMESLKVTLPLPNPLYRNMYDAHHYTSRHGRAAFMELMTGPRCDHVRSAINELLAELELVEALIVRILALSPPLPEQQIHADLHSANVLVTPDGKVSGVLDFEFCAPDWRIMELVVGLSKYIATPGAEEAFEAWVGGYAAAGGSLTPMEAELAPELIIVRVLNNVIYFVGRALAGEDDLDALTSRAQMYSNRCKWIRERAPWMRQVLTDKLVKPTSTN